MSLKLLEEDLRSRIRSGVAITSVVQCAEELVYNSIDSGAFCIAVRIDIPRFKVQVIDNGDGISPDDLQLVGQRYATSKCHAISDLESAVHSYGYRGEALASIVDVTGTLEISTRYKFSTKTLSKLFHHGKQYEVTEGRQPRPSAGTTVTVHDLFYNLPVRRRAVSEALDMERVTRAVSAIALVHPSISFSVRNNQTGQCLMQTSRVGSIQANFTRLFGGGYSQALKHVSVSHAGFNIAGCISTEGHHTKSFQFLYLNKRLVKKTRLHSHLNGLLADSLFSKKTTRQWNMQWENDQLSCQERESLRSPRIVPEKFGTFVLDIQCPRSRYDICHEPAKTLVEFSEWQDIIDALQLLVKKFLKENCLTPTVSPPPGDTHSCQSLSTLSYRERSPLCEGEARYGLQSHTVRRVASALESNSGVPKMPSCTLPLSPIPPSPPITDKSSNTVVSVSRVSDSFPQKVTAQQKENTSPLANNDKERSPLAQHTSLGVDEQASKESSTSNKRHDISQIVSDPLQFAAKATRCPKHHKSQLHLDTKLTSASSIAALKKTDTGLNASTSLSLCNGSLSTKLSDLTKSHCFRTTHPYSDNLHVGVPGSSLCLPASTCTTASCPTQTYSQLPNSPSYSPPPPPLYHSTPFHHVPANQQQSASIATTAKFLSSPVCRSTVSTPSSESKALGFGPLSSQYCSFTYSSSSSVAHGKHTKTPSVQTRRSHSLSLIPFPSTSRLSRSSSKPPSSYLSSGGFITPFQTSLQVASSYSSPSSSSSLYHSISLSSSSLSSSTSSSHSISSSFSSSSTTSSFSSSTTSSFSSSTSSLSFSTSSSHSISSSSSSSSSSSLYYSIFLPSSSSLSSSTSSSHSISSSFSSSTASSSFSSSQPIPNTRMAPSCESSRTSFPLTAAQPAALYTTHSSTLASALPLSSHNFIIDSHSDNILPSTSDSSVSHEPDVVSKGPLSTTASSPVTSGGDCGEENPTVSVASSFPPTASSASSPCTSVPVTQLGLRGAEQSLSRIRQHTGIKSDAPGSNQWRETSDPLTGATVYMHKATGNCVREKPATLISQNENLDVSSTNKHISSSFGQKPLKAAPHLTHDVIPLLPLPKSPALPVVTEAHPVMDTALDSSMVSCGKDSSLISELVSESAKSVSKWRDPSELSQVLSESGGEEQSSGGGQRGEIGALLSSWENPAFAAGEGEVLNIGQSCCHNSQVRVHNIIHPYKFTKAMLSDVKVLGQVDDKFIACVLRKDPSLEHHLLVFFDQHAAHERIRLENLTKDVYEERTQSGGIVQQVRTSLIQPPLPLSLQLSERRLAQLFTNKLENIGVKLVFEGDRTLVTSLPSVLVVREASERRRGRPAVAMEILQEMVVKHLELLQATQGASSMLPLTLHRVLSSQACHGAIKFGDPLSLKECEELIESLSHCQLPFQCAHGRPSLIPIMDLSLLDNQ